LYFFIKKQFSSNKINKKQGWKNALFFFLSNFSKQICILINPRCIPIQPKAKKIMSARSLQSTCLLLSLILFTLPAQAQSGEQIRKDTTLIPGTEVTLEMTYIPGGTFQMKTDDQTQQVKVDDFWIGTYEVTQELYALFQHRDYDNDESDWEEGEYSADAVTRPSPPYTDITFGMGNTGTFPAVSMTQQGALFFCFWLYAKTGEFYRLPTEAEWTYACLAGSDGKYPPQIEDDNLGEYAWHYENSEEKYHKTGQKPANAYGLYDMLGNVAEWTLDKHLDSIASDSITVLDNPWPEPESRYGRVVKGGSFDDYPEDCNCRSRLKSTVQWQKRDPQIPKSLWWNTDAPFVGFRLVKPASPPPAEEIEAFFERAIKW